MPIQDGKHEIQLREKHLNNFIDPGMGFYH